MERMGVIGLGRMGAAAATRLAAQGISVCGWTRSGRAVANVAQAESLERLVDRSDVLLLSLYDDDAVANVLDQLLAFDLTGKLIIETSTVVPTVLSNRIAAINTAGGEAIDAPISGGPEMVLAGTCGIFIGGDDAAAKRAQQVLMPLTTRVFHVGPLGAGMVMKTINNVAMQSYVAALAELLPLAKRAGLSLETAMNILSSGPAAMPMVRDRLPKVFGQDDTVGFPLTAIRKDADVMQQVLASYGLTSEVLKIASAHHDKNLAAGLGNKDPGHILGLTYHMTAESNSEISKDVPTT